MSPSAAAAAAAYQACAAVAEHPIGLGTFMADREKLPAILKHAVQEVGYRRIDCAPVYFNEDIIGDTLAEILNNKNNDDTTKKEGGNNSQAIIQRNDLFLVSKLASPFHRKEHVMTALKKTLTDLRVDYLDLYLLHWPVAFHYVDIDPNSRGYPDEEIDNSEGGKRIDPTVSIHETWAAMEELVDAGLVKYIGVSNFNVMLLHELMSRCRIPPAINQVEAHPYLQNTKLLRYCQKRGVHFQAYSPLGTAGYKESHEPVVLDDPVLKAIAARHGPNCSTAQVCLAWAIQRGTSVVAKTVHPDRLLDNHWEKSISKIHLSEQDMEQIASLDRNYRFFRPEEWWGEYAMAVFD